jgi:hypothetical protein
VETTIKEKRNQVSIQHMKKIQEENPGMAANLVFSKEEDLSLQDLYKLFNDLSRVQEDSQSRLPRFHHGHEAKIGSQRLTRNMVPPAGLSYDHLQTTHLLQQLSWSHHQPEQQFLSVPIPSLPEQNLAPIHTMSAPQILHNKSSGLAPTFTSLME